DADLARLAAVDHAVAAVAAGGLVERTSTGARGAAERSVVQGREARAGGTVQVRSIAVLVRIEHAVAAGDLAVRAGRRRVLAAADLALLRRRVARPVAAGPAAGRVELAAIRAVGRVARERAVRLGAARPGVAGLPR